jgi:hypothetical protein
MKRFIRITFGVIISVLMMTAFNSCRKNTTSSDIKIVFLHHSTGEILWNGAPPTLAKRALGKINKGLADLIGRKAELPAMIEKYNKENSKFYGIEEIEFPKSAPYGWNNYPFDYYNIWVANGGDKPYKDEPTLEMLTKEYQVIIIKHCFPVSNIQPDLDSADINSPHKSIANYKLQYSALRDKMHSFPDTKFIVFTGAVQVKSNITEEEAARAKDFFSWVINEWDIPDDNIFIWDFYNISTEGGLYLKDEYAASQIDSHPNKTYSSKAVRLLFNRIIDVIENDGKTTTLKGEPQVHN